MSLREAKRRGNLYQVVATQIETTPRCQEVAAPCGLAMTSVLLAIRRSEQNTYLVGVSVPEERSISTKGSARSFEPRELK